MASNGPLFEISSETSLEGNYQTSSGDLNSQKADETGVKTEIGKENSQVLSNDIDEKTSEKTEKQKELVQQALNEALLASEIQLSGNELDNTLDDKESQPDSTNDEVCTCTCMFRHGFEYSQ